MKSIKEFNQTMWGNYINSVGKDIKTTNKSYTAWYFCNNEKDANELVELVVSGIKKGTAHYIYLKIEGQTIKV